MDEIVNKTILFVKETLKDAEGGHDWFHIERVFNNAVLIAKGENCNLQIVQLSALLHDIADSKFHDGNETLGPKIAQDFLEESKVNSTVIEAVVAIIKNISFKGGNTQKTFASIELDIVQDADRLDAIGAIGIARAFNYGGFKHRSMYDPAIEPKLNMSKEEYKNSTAPTINHFYEKLLLLKDKMNTPTAHKIAQERHLYMEGFLHQFYAEWQGLK